MKNYEKFLIYLRIPLQALKTSVIHENVEALLDESRSGDGCLNSP